MQDLATPSQSSLHRHPSCPTQLEAELKPLHDRADPEHRLLEEPQ
jgi:hypothetical protein